MSIYLRISFKSKLHAYKKPFKMQSKPNLTFHSYFIINLRGELTFMYILIENFNKLLIKENISISEISNKSGISRVTLSKIFNNNINSNNLSLDTCLKLSQYFDIYFPSILVRSNLDKIYVNEDYLNIFTNNVKYHLKIKNKEQKILSTSPGISESTISELLTGKNKNPRILTLYQISNTLNISIYKLFEESR